MERLTVKDIEKDMNFISIFRTVACVGDSLSSGEIVSRNKEGNFVYHDWFEYSWGQYMARKGGFKCYNFSRGGMTAKEYMETFAALNRFFNVEYAAQAYVIALGVNDLLGHKMEVGSVDDIDLEDPSKNKPTFAGYYAQVIQKYKEINPRACFFLVTMPKTDREETDAKGEAQAKLLHDMAKIFSNTYVVDLYNKAPVYDVDFEKRYMMNHHMTVAGYLFSAELINKLINEQIVEHLNDFDESAFIGGNLKR